MAFSSINSFNSTFSKNNNKDTYNSTLNNVSSWTITRSGPGNNGTGTGATNSTSPFLPSSNNLPTGSDYANFFFIQSYYGASVFTLSHTISLNNGPYTLSLYSALRQGNYSSQQNTFSISIGGTSIATNIVGSNSYWTYYSYNYTPPSAGQYVLSITTTCPSSVSDSTIDFVNIKIVTAKTTI